MNMSLCKICEEAQSKYKCPKCFAPYCSLVCFKKHKETPCEPNTPAKEQQQQHETPRKEVIQLGDPEDDEPSRLTADDLQKLAYSEQVRDFLKNPHIRELVKAIDHSQNPEQDLANARGSDPLFDEFTKKLVEITFHEKLERKEQLQQSYRQQQLQLQQQQEMDNDDDEEEEEEEGVVDEEN